MEYKKETFSWINPLLIAKEIPGLGMGVFSEGQIKKDEILTVFGGYVQEIVNEKYLPAEIADNCHMISDKLVFGIKKVEETETSSFFNHSCEPNAGFKGQIFLVAMRDIKIGEQVTFDYAMVLSKSDDLPSYSFDCKCSSANCRGQVTESDWEKPELQKKYEGYFQWYLEEKIKKLR